MIFFAPASLVGTEMIILTLSMNFHLLFLHFYLFDTELRTPFLSYATKLPTSEAQAHPCGRTLFSSVSLCTKSILICFLILFANWYSPFFSFSGIS